eukprot:2306807-Rhodomonas_salina.2
MVLYALVPLQALPGKIPSSVDRWLHMSSGVFLTRLGWLAGYTDSTGYMYTGAPCRAPTLPLACV